MKRFLVFFTFFVFIISSFSSGARAEKNILEENLDKATIRKLLDFGQILTLKYDAAGNISHRVCGVLVNAPSDLVWNVLNDFKNYDEFIIGMEEPSIGKSGKGATIVDFVLKIKVLAGIGTTQKYSQMFVPRKPKLFIYDPEKPDREPGFWSVAPTDDGKTILFYYDMAPDLNDMGKLISGVAKSKQEFAIALQVSPVSVLVNSVKAYAEKKAAKK